MDEMLVTPTGLRAAPETQPIPQPSSAAPSVEAAPAEVLISTQQVLFGTAAVQATRRAPLGGRIASAVRRMAADANQPRHPHYPRHYTYLENARMAREMDRL
ncbi:hypothetical protein A5621_19190 [Mycobacterium colombiense]|nr:hypothetical protein A5620_05575 [Mycobacterium colombiense]OBJ34231.1 hypothetical protein A5621_19190 [Mycobacterium colombiense]OBJ64352.1 hypothetical protein A5627_07415 [Mycobacterium colombiense]